MALKPRVYRLRQQRAITWKLQIVSADWTFVRVLIFAGNRESKPINKMKANNNADPRRSAKNFDRLLSFVDGCGARPGGDQRGSENHTDESESDQNVMHPGFSLWACQNLSTNESSPGIEIVNIPRRRREGRIGWERHSHVGGITDGIPVPKRHRIIYL
jgi:hypothetical protein